MAVVGLTILAILTVLGVFANILSIGKPRKPITNGQAATVAFLGAVYVAFYAYLASQL